MSTLPAAIDEAAASRRFNGLTLYVTKDGRWQAGLRRGADVTTWTVEIADTPSAALEKLFGAPSAPVAESVFD